MALNGTNGDDNFTGTSFGDEIFGFGGNDGINGSPGEDTINGGADTDTIDYSQFRRSPFLSTAKPSMSTSTAPSSPVASPRVTC